MISWGSLFPPCFLSAELSTTMNFFENLLRYPRFFLSSMVGLCLIVLNPLIELVQAKQPKLGLAFFFLTVLSIFLFNVIREMTNPTY